MNLTLSEIELPVRLRFDRPVSDEDLVRFCAANVAARVERNSNGELVVMSPVALTGVGRRTMWRWS